MHCSLSAISPMESVSYVAGTTNFFGYLLSALIVNGVFITSRMDLEDCISLNSVFVWKCEHISISLRGMGGISSAKSAMTLFSGGGVLD